jgi:lipopolysaccharide/colanic/teichoic acid biosynthesis glycosyltransferase
MLKRVFDVVVSACGLVVVAPLFFVAAVAIKLDSSGPVFFRQQRVGRFFQPFRIFKFRTMVQDAPQRGAAITSHGDPRVTRVGRILRRTKVDELPQLLNVLRGDMSLVGPRPEVDQYVQLFRTEFAQILTVRPGITDLASVAFPDEEKVLAAVADPAEEYRQRILPRKLQLSRESIAKSSLWFDIGVIVRTFYSIVGKRSQA